VVGKGVGLARRRAVAFLLVVALAVGGLGAGCGDDDTPEAHVGELRIGVLVPITGDLAPFGGPGAKAAQLAADQVKAATGDSGLELRLVQENTRTDPQHAQAAAGTLIENDGVSALVGPWASSEVIPTAENVSVAAAVPLVSPSATSPAITGLDDDDLVFRTAPSDVLQGRVLAHLVADRLGPHATVVTANRDDAYGVGLVGEFTRAWEAGGGRVLRNVAYDPGGASLDGEAGVIASGKPDGWVIIDFPETWAKKMGPALVRTGSWDPARTFTADGLRSNSLPESAGREATEGMSGTAPTSLGAPAGRAFDALWRKDVGEPRQTYDAQTFDAVVLVALAAAAGGSSDSAAIAEKLRAVSEGGTKYTFENLAGALTAAAAGKDIDYEGASGPIELDGAGDPAAADYATWSYRDGKLVDDTNDVIRIGPGG
jgi:ABC-type branched-subunit amino acid transport system substrate-binding protein